MRPVRPRATERHARQVHLGLFVASVAGLLATIAIAPSTVGSDVSAVPLAAFVALSVIAAHRESVFSDETAVSGSVLVTCAAILGFGVSSPAIPLACAAGAAFHLSHVRESQFRKLTVNAGATVIPTFLGTKYLQLLHDAGVARTGLAVFGVVGIYWLLNNAIVGVALALAHGRALRNTVVSLIKADSVMVVFAIGGALCGFVMAEVGVWIGFAALVAALVALDVFVVSLPAGPAVFRSTWKVAFVRMVAGFAAGVCAVTVTEAWGGELGGAVVGGVTGVTLGLVLLVGVAVVRLRAAGHRPDPIMLTGFAVAELPLVSIAAMAGVMGGTLGTAAALLTASCLAIVASALSAWNRKRTAPRQLGGDDDVVLAAVIEAILDGMPDTARVR